MAEDTSLLLTVEEAAERLRIGRTSMYRLISAGDIPSLTLGRRRLVPSESLTKYVSALLAAEKTAA